MKNFDKKFTIICLLLFIFILLSVILKNIILDPFSIFADTNYEAVKNKKIYPNERYLKMKYILLNKNKYDSFLFGSCSCNLINLEKVPYGKWYSMTYPDNSMWDIKRVLSLMIREGVIVRRVCIGISERCLRDDEYAYLYRQKDSLNYLPYPITLREKIYFYLRYLLYSPIFDKHKKYDYWNENAKKNIYKGGSYADNLPDKPEQSEATDYNSFKNIANPYPNKEYNNKHIEILKEIVNICKINNIDFNLFIVPEYIEVYQGLDEKALNKIKKELALVTPFYDFSGGGGINEITLSKKYFIDPFHINNWTSKLIVDRIFYEDKNQPPKIKNFGNYIL